MKSNDVLLLGGLGIAAWLFWQKANAAGNLIILPGGVSNVALDGSTPVIDLTLLVQNTSSTGFTVESLAGNVFCDNTLIGNISSFVPVAIPANAQVNLPVRLRLQMVGIVNQIFQAFNVGNLKKNLQLTGFVNAGFVRAPIDVPFSIGN